VVARLDHTALARWRGNPLEFIEAVLHDPETRKPFVLLPAERTFLQHAFTLNDRGRLVYPEQVYSCPKKSGKTTLAALHALTLLLLFGAPYGEVVLAANDFDQATGRVFAMIKRIVETSPLLKSEAKIITDKITFPAFNAVVTAIAQDAAGAAGGDQVLAVFDELWGYQSELAHRLWDELVVPPTRKIAARLTVTYAGFTGESNLLETLYQRGLAQPLIGPDLYAGDGILMFWSHGPVAPWQDEAWLADMRRSLRPNAYLRMIENRFVSTESTFVDVGWWDLCTNPAITPLVSQPTLPVCVGVDASVKRDSTAIVAVHWDKRAQKCRLIWHRIFQPSVQDPLDFEVAIEDTLRDLHSRFRVQKILYDPYQMAATAQRLVREGLKLEEYPQSVPNLTAASQNLYELIKGRNLQVYPDAAIRLAISRAVAIETARGWRIAKDKQSHKIDVVVALAMAAHAAVSTKSSYDTSMRWVSDSNDETAAEDMRRARLQWHIRTGGYRYPGILGG
jgi:phage terminase large subunit-like protein